MRWQLVAVLLAACSFEHARAPSGSDDANPNETHDGPGPGDGASISKDAAIDASTSITCPGAMCGSVCCEGACAAVVCTGKIYRCDGPEDCAGTEVCCNDQNGSFCTTSTCNGSSRFEACHSASDCSFTCDDCSFRSDYGQKVCCE